ncbi:hypothetical protein TNCT_177121 [Trichonephila clavata]|uniref:Uncharacterized protein n=1 Tax=Trichonephila clavata TaxID=2740835 RepID=A0A8X6FJ10_TRICU|nr:hypothetical protein TNCT_177121 [Trichonephila clavata]
MALPDLVKSSGNLKVECAVRPPASRAAMHTAMSFSFLTKASSKLSRKVLPVPPGASKKTMPPLSFLESHLILFWSFSCSRKTVEDLICLESYSFFIRSFCKTCMFYCF